MKKKFYITTAIDYVNAKPHIGHAYQKIIADVLARWNKQGGKEVFFLTGTDEHGQKIAKSAEEKGKSPQKFVDEISPKFKEAWKSLNINFDKFIRTTDAEHEKKVQEFVKLMEKKGDIYKGEYSGLYCEGCEAYVTEKDMINGKCQFHPNRELKELKEQAYFFRLSKYEKKLLDLYKKNKNFILPEFRRQEIINRVKEGLKDLNITRLKKNMSWGIQFPLDEKYVIYVWYEALLNYLTGIEWPNGKNFKKFWPADVEILGIDNSWFHCVIWPAMLFSAGIKTPETILINGFLTFNGQKISKSLGNSISPIEMVKKYGVDSLRYYVCRNFVFGQNGDFSEDVLIKRHNDELADKLGNLVSRVSALIEKNGVEKCEDKIKLSKEWKKIIKEGRAEIEETPEDPNLEKGVICSGGSRVHELVIKEKERRKGDPFDKILSEHLQLFSEATSIFVERHMERFEFDKALNEIFRFIDHCNWYVQVRKIWETKNKKDLYKLAESIKEIAKLLWAFMPETSKKITKQFSTAKIKKGEILFKKI